MSAISISSIEISGVEKHQFARGIAVTHG